MGNTYNREQESGIMGASEGKVGVVLHVDHEYLLRLAEDGSSSLREFECKRTFVWGLVEVNIMKMLAGDVKERED